MDLNYHLIRTRAPIPRFKKKHFHYSECIISKHIGAALTNALIAWTKRQFLPYFSDRHGGRFSYDTGFFKKRKLEPDTQINGCVKDLL